ncbi:MAG: hypothetical protein C6P37_01565 [Caldibacillus debilis]|uniref:Uncharacterized protein n=1 Tax=Caldibacillus debilis TaxID=301148 RepID=A0A3E0K8Z0_9BACI|nr:MAG: hypothetical protein BAA03_13440 [Caldibacillus debilis]REJ23766.1 MAG: hypothetical protein C6W56_15175 [Caldibacillus debilis]REJ31353.1 MAG: hypothetical protein C6P37_01565 [Caldibacillus debilis]
MKKINGKLGEEGVGRHSADSSFFFYTGGKGRAAAKGFASNQRRAWSIRNEGSPLFSFACFSRFFRRQMAAGPILDP